MTELSPAAKAILSNVAEQIESEDSLLPYEQEIVAAALRSAANQIIGANPEWLGSSGAVWFQEQLRFASLEIEQNL